MRKNMAKMLGVIGTMFVVGMIILAIAGPYAVPYDPGERTGAPLSAPDQEHWLGTNDIGQDILAELVAGARTSLTIGLIGAVFVMIVGTAVGLVAGYWGGRVDTILMRTVDIFLTLPFLPLMIVVGVFIGPSAATMIGVITLVMWAKVSRELRSQILSLRTRGPVLAARSMGGTDVYILRKHVLPGIVPLLIPQFVQTVNAAIMMESSLSFLGLGDPLAKSWGSILFYANARSAFLTDAWLWWVLPAGFCIVITVLGFSFIGYWMEERVSPRLKTYNVPVLRKRESTSNPIDWNQVKEANGKPILAVKQLDVSFPNGGGVVHALKNVNLSVNRGEIVGVVGESGSGKSTMAMAVMQMLKPPADCSGKIELFGQDLTACSSDELRRLRGKRMALIPQAAMNALNPVMSVRTQMREAILCHRSMSKQAADERVDELLGYVGLESDWGEAFPHELSGGMRQRVVIAMALVNEPEFVIADEPTTGLDVKVQAEIISLLEELQKKLGLSMLFITHDLPVVLHFADRIVVLRNGEVADEGPAKELAYQSAHPYTRKLMDSIPRIGEKGKAQREAWAEMELVQA